MVVSFDSDLSGDFEGVVLTSLRPCSLLMNLLPVWCTLVLTVGFKMSKRRHLKKMYRHDNGLIHVLSYRPMRKSPIFRRPGGYFKMSWMSG